MQIINPKSPKYKTHILLTIFCLVVTFFACVATAEIFDRQNWPVFHFWGLLHGSIFVLFPIYFLLFYWCGLMVLRAPPTETISEQGVGSAFRLAMLSFFYRLQPFCYPSLVSERSF